MCISKDDAMLSNLIDIGRIDFSLRIETGNITHPQIIRQNKNDVGTVAVQLGIDQQKGKKEIT
jgi:hypothetical protein